jgi:hypothetical protein
MAGSPKDKLKNMTAWDKSPALSDAEIDDLLAAASVADPAGFVPSDSLWTPTYDLNAAAAAGWLIKAGRASPTVEIDPPGSGIFTSKVFDNCRAMARLYAAKCSTSVPINTASG